jgi:VanZ family protein
MRVRTFFSWLGVVFFIFLVIQSSRDVRFGAEYAQMVIRGFFPKISEDSMRMIIIVVRKMVHVTSYGLLTLLLYVASSGTEVLRDYPRVWAVVMALGIAIFDEILQYFQAFRSGRLLDVLIDGIGIFLASCLIRRQERISRGKLEG